MAKKRHELAFAGSQEALWRPQVWASFGFQCTVTGPPVHDSKGRAQLPVAFAGPVQLGDEIVPAGQAVFSSMAAVQPVGPVAVALYLMEDADASRND